eukprot:scaffold194_cov277-Pinguiococcus_pyrenoidosus.AAC.6
MEAKLRPDAGREAPEADLAKDTVESDANPVDFQLEELRVGPSNAPVGAKLDLEMGFRLGRAVRNAVWRVHVEVDRVHARHRIELGETPASHLAEGANELFFSTDGINVDGVDSATLGNAAILAAVLWEGDRELTAVNMVVLMHEHAGELLRTIHSPLE